MQTDYDVGKALERIEHEMIDSMMRNIGRHIREQEKEGFEWSQWQVEELRSLEEYRKKNQKKYGPQFKEINKRMLEAIEEAKERGSSDQEIEILEALQKGHIPDRMKNPNGDITGPISNGFFGVNQSKMDALVKATENDMQRAEYAVLRRANDQYRRIIFDAEVYANSGAGTVEKAVDMATKDFLSRGIDSIQYSNGARHTISDYADMVIKTAETRAYLMGQGEKRAEWGEQLVIVNKRAGDYPCPHCIPWVGKILIDDVYSGGKPDGKHKLLSEAIAAGFLHPRCRDIFTTYFPGISSEPDPVTRAEAKEAAAVEHQENQQQYAERQAEKFGRLAEYSLDPDNKRMYSARAEQWTEKSDDLAERRKKRLAQRKTTLPESNESIAFDEKIADGQRQLIEDLSAQYRTRLQQVMLGAEKAAGDVDISGARMRLNDKHASTAMHEFAHSLAHTNADKFGLTDDQDFWKEIKRIRREYMKAVEGDPSKWISTYEHSSRSVDEFMAEAFTHAKMRELGLKIPDKYGSDFTYSQRVLDTVDKYFGKAGQLKGFEPAADIAEAQEYAQKFIAPNFMDKVFKGKADFKGISLDHANEINMALAEVYDRFPELDKISGIKVVSPNSARGKKAFKDGADALFSYDPLQHGIFVNKDVLMDAKTLEEYMKRSQESWDLVMNNLDKLSDSQRAIAERYATAGRSLVDGDTVMGLFTHELGHHVQWTMLDANTTNSVTSRIKKYAPKISGYASNSSSEYLAESFVAYMKGERQLLDPEYVEYLDKRLKTGMVKAKKAVPEPVMSFNAVLESNAVKVMREEYAPWVESLTRRELHAIRKYSKNSLKERASEKFYVRLNAMLRGDIPEDSYLRGYANTISKALKRKPLENDMILYRNLDVDPFADVPIGHKAPGKQFFSTSVIGSRTMPGEYQLIIQAPKGTPGAYIEKISRVPGQREFLIDKDCEYRVVSRRGKTIVLEVVV